MTIHHIRWALTAALLSQAPAAFGGEIGRSHACASVKNSPLDEPEWYARQCVDASMALAPEPERGPGPNLVGNTAYQLNLRAVAPVAGAQQMQSFSIPSPMPSPIAPTALATETRKLFAMDFDDVTRTFYAVDNNTLELGTIDRATGAFTVLGVLTGVPLGHVITGLSIDPRPNGSTYLSTTNTAASTLSKVNRTTRVVTPVGDIGFEQVIDIAVNCKGELYGHDIVSDQLIRIDPATGAGVAVGATGVDANFAQGIDFDHSDGTLYGWMYQGGGTAKLVTFNLATGAATTVANEPSGEYEGAIPNACFDAKGNFNRDRTPELLFRNTATNENAVWFMDGVNRIGTAATTVTPAPASDWQLVASDDFDSASAPGTGPDGMSDLVFLNQSTRWIQFWLMNGASRVGSAITIGGIGVPLGGDWKIAATGDFNNDRRPDIVFRKTTAPHSLEVWLMNGTQKVGTAIPNPAQAADANWEVVAALDYNHDGFRDLLWYNATSGKIVLWWLDANLVRIAGFFTTPDAAGDSNWKVVAGGDYSADTQTNLGVADIVWRNATSGNLVVWHMGTDGARLPLGGGFTNPPSHTGGLNWIVVGPR